MQCAGNSDRRHPVRHEWLTSAMGIAAPIVLLALTLSVLLAALQNGATFKSSTAQHPERQIAYQMRQFHQASVKAKVGAPATLGMIAPLLPASFTDWRFASCASANSVLTSFAGQSIELDRAVLNELLQQSQLPPEIGFLTHAPQIRVAAAPGSVAIFSPPGIGRSDGAYLRGGASAIALACPIPVGMIALQTQLAP